MEKQRTKPDYLTALIWFVVFTISVIWLANAPQPPYPAVIASVTASINILKALRKVD